MLVVAFDFTYRSISLTEATSTFTYGLDLCLDSKIEEVGGTEGHDEIYLVAIVFDFVTVAIFIVAFVGRSRGHSLAFIDT